MRADATRNRDALLRAAAEVFAEQGPDAPLDEVARRARVGNATMYRHFPARRDLLVAVYSDEVDALLARGRDLLTGADPVQALFAWLGEFAGHVRGKRALAESIDGDRAELFERWHAGMHATAAALVERARDGLAPGVTEVDLLSLAVGIALAPAGDPVRLLALARRGVEAAR